MENNLKPIETEYSGYRFRSRLEARWAVFFDTLGIKYEYEKEGYDLGKAGYYLPDFWLPYYNCFVEIKGKEPSKVELSKLSALSDAVGVPCILFHGLPCENYGYAYLYILGESGGGATYSSSVVFVSGINDEIKIDIDESWTDDEVVTQNWKPLKGYAYHPYGKPCTYNKHSRKLSEAVKAAKSARFEHSETPSIKSNSFVEEEVCKTQESVYLKQPPKTTLT